MTGMCEYFEHGVHVSEDDDKKFKAGDCLNLEDLKAPVLDCEKVQFLKRKLGQHKLNNL